MEFFAVFLKPHLPPLRARPENPRREDREPEAFEALLKGLASLSAYGKNQLRLM
jgi:hypothetical protein